MNCSYNDVVNLLNNFKSSIDDNIKKYNDEIKPKILHLEKQFVLNNYIPHLTMNDLDSFMDDSVNVCDYCTYEANESRYGGNSCPEANAKYNFIKTETRVAGVKGRYSMKTNYDKLKINHKNILKVLKLNKYEDLKLYFDDEYKKQIVEYDTMPCHFYSLVEDKENGTIIEHGIYIETSNWPTDTEKNLRNKIINTTIYTNYNFIIKLKLLNVKIKFEINKKSCPGKKYINFENIMYGNEINFNFDVHTINTVFNQYRNKYDTSQKCNIEEIKFVNTVSDEEYIYTNDDPLNETKLHEFISGCKKELNLKILIDYLKTKPLDEIYQFFNQIDGYTKFSNETIIIEKNNIIDEQQKSIKNLKNTIQELKNEMNILQTNNSDKINEADNNLTEINRLKKQFYVMEQKYKNLDKLYNNLLESKY